MARDVEKGGHLKQIFDVVCEMKVTYGVSDKEKLKIIFTFFVGWSCVKVVPFPEMETDREISRREVSFGCCELRDSEDSSRGSRWNLESSSSGR